MFFSAMLAHQGGWDEILFVLLPLLIFAGLLAIAKRRAERLEAAQRQDGSPTDRPASRQLPPDA